jgi:uroporphyrinogen decarboxylase
MLAALDNKEGDHVPLCFMIYAGLRNQSENDYEFVKTQLEMGLDATVALPMLPLEDPPTDHRDLPGLPVGYHPDVEIREWREDPPGGKYPVLHKEYHTPEGVLSTAVDKTDDWPYGDHVPFLDDYLSPRSHSFLVEGQDDLAALRYLLTSPADEDVEAFCRQAEKDREFAAEHDLLVTGGRGVGIEASAWLCGFRNVAVAAMRRPEYVDELAGILHDWNQSRMRVFLDAGVDLFVRRGWYEGTDFWSPSLFRRFILPHLKAEIDMAHDAGARFGYIMTSGSMPLLELLADAGLDVLIGVDPVQGMGTDMALMKSQLGGKVALWGGVNGFITVEMGSKAQVAEAVRTAMKTLGPSGGFILSPVDNVRDTSHKTQENVETMIEVWKEMREYPLR